MATSKTTTITTINPGDKSRQATIVSKTVEQDVVDNKLVPKESELRPPVVISTTR